MKKFFKQFKTLKPTEDNELDLVRLTQEEKDKIAPEYEELLNTARKYSDILYQNVYDVIPAINVANNKRLVVFGSGKENGSPVIGVRVVFREEYTGATKYVEVFNQMAAMPHPILEDSKFYLDDVDNNIVLDTDNPISRKSFFLNDNLYTYAGIDLERTINLLKTAYWVKKWEPK